MEIDVTQCKDCVYFIFDHCSMWNKSTIPSGYCHQAEKEVPEDE